MEIKSLGLLGKEIAHSQSPRLYREALAPAPLEYILFDCESAQSIPPLEAIFSKVEGLSITAPYKDHFLSETVIPDPVVKQLGAINCVGKNTQGYIATNTDLSAMRRLLPPLAKARNVIILGDGAMARVAQIVCQENDIAFIQSSRRANGDEFAQFAFKQVPDGNVLVVNCCGRGYVFNCSLPESAIFWDMNYSHADHMQLFKDSKQYLDGINLLEAQAQDALNFWNLLKS